MLEQALAIMRELNDRHFVALALSNIGSSLILEGDLTAARERLDETLTIARELGDRAYEGNALADLGWLALLRGSVTVARQGLQEGLALSREMGDKKYTGSALRALAEVERERADPGSARRLLEESLTLAVEMGGDLGEALVHTSVARLDLDEGRPADAETEAGRAEQAFHEMKDLDAELEAIGLRARALADQGKIEAAARAIAARADWVRRTENVPIRLAFGLDAAYVAIAASRSGPSAGQLSALQREAASRGFAGIELEARLLLGRLALHSGDGPAALTAVEHDARARGFERVARLAAAARAGG